MPQEECGVPIICTESSKERDYLSFAGLKKDSAVFVINATTCNNQNYLRIKDLRSSRILRSPILYPVVPLFLIIVCIQ